MSINSGRVKLVTSLKEIKVRWSKVSPLWDDAVRKSFEKEFLDPLEGKVRSAVTAMEEMQVLLTKARKDCS